GFDGTDAMGKPVPTVRLWGLRPRPGVASVRLFELYEGVTVSAVAFAPAGKTLAWGGTGNVIRVVDPATAKDLARLAGHTGAGRRAHRGAVGGLASTRGAWGGAPGSHDGTARIWDHGAGKEVAALAGKQGQLTCSSVAPDGKTLAVGSATNTVTLWDLPAR